MISREQFQEAIEYIFRNDRNEYERERKGSVLNLLDEDGKGEAAKKLYVYVPPLGKMLITMGIDKEEKYAWCLREFDGKLCIVLHEKNGCKSSFSGEDYVTSIPICNALLCLMSWPDIMDEEQRKCFDSVIDKVRNINVR